MKSAAAVTIAVTVMAGLVSLNSITASPADPGQLQPMQQQHPEQQKNLQQQQHQQQQRHLAQQQHLQQQQHAEKQQQRRHQQKHQQQYQQQQQHLQQQQNQQEQQLPQQQHEAIDVVGLVRQLIVIGEETSSNDTFYTNPSYPSAETTLCDPCSLTVKPMNSNICQIRIDMIEFTLDQPVQPTGVCQMDLMTVVGGSYDVPIICGDNAGKHMYVEVSPTFNEVTIAIYIKPGSVQQKWMMKVSQIECDSPWRAPAGCLQYYSDTFGYVSSFNYVSTTASPTTTRQLANEQYAICLAPRPTFCSVTWSKPTNENIYHFTMSGDAIIIPPTRTPPVPPSYNADCTTDYVIIAGGIVVDPLTPPVTAADRFCGLAFPTSVQSFAMPFILHVVTDADESVAGDFVNQGFSLFYTMNLC